MRKVKKYDFGEWLMYSHLPSIRQPKREYAAYIALAIIVAGFITYIQLSGAATTFTYKAAEVIRFIF